MDFKTEPGFQALIYIASNQAPLFTILQQPIWSL